MSSRSIAADSGKSQGTSGVGSGVAGLLGCWVAGCVGNGTTKYLDGLEVSTSRVYAEGTKLVLKIQATRGCKTLQDPNLAVSHSFSLIFWMSEVAAVRAE